MGETHENPKQDSLFHCRILNRPPVIYTKKNIESFTAELTCSILFSLASPVDVAKPSGQVINVEAILCSKVEFIPAEARKTVGNVKPSKFKLSTS
jgi:hypothetical protein